MNRPHEANVSGKSGVWRARVSSETRKRSCISCHRPQALQGIRRSRHATVTGFHRRSQSRPGCLLPANASVSEAPRLFPPCLPYTTTEAHSRQGSSARCSGPRRPAQTRRISHMSAVAARPESWPLHSSDEVFSETFANKSQLAQGCGFFRGSPASALLRSSSDRLPASICACGSMSETPTAPVTATTATLKRDLPHKPLPSKCQYARCPSLHRRRAGLEPVVPF